MEKHYINHTEFAKELGISKSTLDRRAKEIGHTFPRSLLSSEERADFLQKHHEWEQNRIHERNKKIS